MATKPNSSSQLPFQRTYNVSVVGLSGSESERGSVGVGKSCFCNRFVRPHADDFFMRHLYALSHSDFSSRIVNHEHWLYWGRVSKLLHASAPIHTSKPGAPQFVSNATLLQSRPGSDASAATTLSMPNPIESNAPRVELVFHVAEQTEFVDNETLRTCARPGARLEPYAKRCLTQKLQSPGKRMYFSQDQLGISLDLYDLDFFIL